MKIGLATEYGFRGIIYLAKVDRDRPVTIDEICERQDVPKNYLIKIFKNLSHARLIRSHKGYQGGFSLMRPAAEITAREVYEALRPVRDAGWELSLLRRAVLGAGEVLLPAHGGGGTSRHEQGLRGEELAGPCERPHGHPVPVVAVSPAIFALLSASQVAGLFLYKKQYRAMPVLLLLDSNG